MKIKDILPFLPKEYLFGDKTYFVLVVSAVKSEKQAKKIKQACNSFDTTKAEIFLLDEVGGKITLDTELSYVQN